MKNISLLFGQLLLAAVTFAQAPQAFKYQAVARNASGEPLENQEISVLISILAGNPSGTVVYSERHLTTTNGLGLFDLEIGNPDEVLSGIFSEINWGTGSYFLKLELDEIGGTNYQLIGVSQLLSVPYALNSSSLALKSPNGRTFEVTVDDEGNLITNCIINPGNQSPETPTSPIPEDGSSNHPINIDLSWACTDPDGDPLTFDVYFGTEANPPQAATGLATTTFDPGALSYSTEYFWKIVANDDHGNISEGTVWSFSTQIQEWQCGDPFTDTRDGKTYTTVQIGTQCWMAQNLNVGTRIDSITNQTDNGTIEKYCYHDSAQNCDVYGGLYQWNEMMSYSTNSILQGICPQDFHLPTDAEWCILTTYLDATVNCSADNWSSTDAGGKMKEAGTAHWSSPNYGATNSSGFTALPGGISSPIGSFGLSRAHAIFWTTNIYDYRPWYRHLKFDSSQLGRAYTEKGYGLSVRCIKNN